MQYYSLNEIIYASYFLLRINDKKLFKERNDIMVQDSPKNHLKEQIESEEMILKTKFLEVRSQVAKKIEKAQQDSDKTYQMRLKEIDERKAEQISHIDSRFREYVKTIEDIEERTFQEIITKYEQREEEIITKLLKNILP
jgi:hypothetical protein